MFHFQWFYDKMLYTVLEKACLRKSFGTEDKKSGKGHFT